jgi:hypothetical protein
MADADDFREQNEAHLTGDLSDAHRAEARRISAALTRTRTVRREHAAAVGVDSASAPLPLCGALLSDGGLCLLPTPHGPEHRVEPAPAALQVLVADLRREVADARHVAVGLYRSMRPALAPPSRRTWRRGGCSPAPSRSRPPEPYGVTPGRLIAARADFVTAVAADEPHRAGGHWEALGWVLADLHAGWPLTYDYGPLTLAVAAEPELARILVAVAGFTITSAAAKQATNGLSAHESTPHGHAPQESATASLPGRV